MVKLRKILALIMIAAVASFSITGCESKSDKPPVQETVTEDKIPEEKTLEEKAEKVADEHPKGEHPTGEHPK